MQSMQISLDSFSLKPFTRALTCLSRYGDDITLCATASHLAISATNSSKSAYCRFKYSKPFFSRYRVMGGREDEEAEGGAQVTGQLLTKSLLTILKHRAVEKTVDRCELSIVEGVLPSQNTQTGQDDADEDSLESRLIVRLHCKHGVTKTHRLVLQSSPVLMTPGIPESARESRLTVNAKSVKDVIEHFPAAKGKSDPQLVWSFGAEDVCVRSFESALGKSQLATELNLSAEEFNVYAIHSIPTTIAFHLREFSATIAYAESANLALDVKFTDAAAPLVIQVEADMTDALFVISTSQVPGSFPPPSQPISRSQSQNTRKRPREESERLESRVVSKKPMKAAVPAPEYEYERGPSRATAPLSSMPPPLLPSQSQRTPLFLPSSQMSLRDIDEATGLGLEGMNAEELDAMLEGEGEEVAFDFTQGVPGGDEMSGGGDGGGTQWGEDMDMGGQAAEEDAEEEPNGREDSLDLIDEDAAMPQTQSWDVTEGAKPFKALFED